MCAPSTSSVNTPLSHVEGAYLSTSCGWINSTLFDLSRALRAAAQQRFRQPDGNGGELQHVASGDCVTVSSHLQDLDLAPCGMGLRDGSQNFSFSEVT